MNADERRFTTCSECGKANDRQTSLAIHPLWSCECSLSSKICAVQNLRASAFIGGFFLLYHCAVILIGIAYSFQVFADQQSRVALLADFVPIAFCRFAKREATNRFAKVLVLSIQARRFVCKTTKTISCDFIPLNFCLGIHQTT